MKNKTISFSTGKLIVNDKDVSFHVHNGRANTINTIGRENIGHTELHNMRVLPKDTIIYCFRMFFLGLAFLILGFIVKAINDSEFMIWGGIVFIFFSFYLLFSILVLDGMLGLNVTVPILLRFFGVDATRVVVQNIYGGNNLMFLVRQDERKNVPKFEEYKLEKIYTVESTNKSKSDSNGIDDLEKIAALKEKGIITQEEFELKKKQILGL